MAPTEQQARQARARQLAGRGRAAKARVQRYLKSTEPRLCEAGAKTVLLLKGIRASRHMMDVLRELRALQAPHGRLLSKRNPIVVFGDAAGQQSLEFLMTKNDAALFCLATHSKKRPNNLVVGRTFDRQLLDSAELGVTHFKSMQEYGGGVPKKRVGSKPLLLFEGDLWQRYTDYRNLQNLLTDFYRGEVVDKLVATGLDHIIVFTAAEDPSLPPHPGSSSSSSTAATPGAGVRIHQRTYHAQLKKHPDPGVAAPAAHLTHCGPDLDLVLRRTAWADPALHAAARRQPAALRTRTKKKNQSTNALGETVGRLHLRPQKVQNMGGRKAKALRRAERAERQEERAAIEADLEREKEALGQEFQSAFGFRPDDDDKNNNKMKSSKNIKA